MLKPSWLRRRLPAEGISARVRSVIAAGSLCSVCVQARCPTQVECLARGTARFLLPEPAYTGRYTFCAVDRSAARPVDPSEPIRVAHAVAGLNLVSRVLTMVTRDDLPDGGSGHVARIVRAIRRELPRIRIEPLISDLLGTRDALGTIPDVVPEKLNHKRKTVPSLYGEVRAKADYERSLERLARPSGSIPRVMTKSGIMLSLDERRKEVLSSGPAL
jgi:lipoic acid synthetase